MKYPAIMKELVIKNKRRREDQSVNKEKVWVKTYILVKKKGKGGKPEIESISMTKINNDCLLSPKEIGFEK